MIFEVRLQEGICTNDFCTMEMRLKIVEAYADTILFFKAHRNDLCKECVQIPSCNLTRKNL